MTELPLIEEGSAASQDERAAPFVQATVVRAQHPTSAHAGDAARVLPDGRIDGFVGGQCVEGSVATAAQDVLATGEPLLLRVLPDGAEPFPEVDGARTVVNPCLSGGAIEVFLTPVLPRPRIGVAGGAPVARALTDLLPALGFEACDVLNADVSPGLAALVVATHGHDEEDLVRAAIASEVAWIGLVASRTRGTSVLDSLGLDDEQRARVHTPVGLDIGARTAAEIALSIAAALVRARRLEGLQSPGLEAPAPAQVIDPVCGMTVTVTEGTPHVEHDGQDYWFCAPGCAARFREDLDRHAT